MAGVILGALELDVAGRADVEHRSAVGQPAHDLGRICHGDAVLDGVELEELDALADELRRAQLPRVGFLFEAEGRRPAIERHETRELALALVAVQVYRFEKTALEAGNGSSLEPLRIDDARHPELGPHPHGAGLARDDPAEVRDELFDPALVEIQ